MCDYTDRLTKVPGEKNQYYCPVCGGNNLEVQPDSTKYKCFNGCSNEAVREAVRPLTEALEEARPKKVHQGEERRSWIYPDINGLPCIKVVRVDDGNGKKKIYQEFAIDGQWTTNATESQKDDLKERVSIFRLKEIQRAIAEGQPIFWVEGEKTADRLWELGLPATTSIGGTSAYRKYSDYGNPLRDAQLVICPDQDLPGMEYAKKVEKDHPGAQWLHAFPQSSAWDNLPKDKGIDLYDWIQAEGLTAVELMAAIEPHRKGYVEPADEWGDFKNAVLKIGEITDPLEREFRLRRVCNGAKMPLSIGKDILESARGKAYEFKPVDVVDFMAEKQGDREWLIAGHIPTGSVINLCAMGGTGKTALAYEWSKHIISGLEWNGFPVRTGNVLLVQSDEPEMDTQEKLEIQDFYSLPRNRCFIFFNWITTGLDQMVDFIKAKDINFIVIDSLAAINIGADRDRSEFADPLRLLRDLANDLQCTFLVLDHTNKSGSNLGTIAVHNAVSEMMYLKHPTEDEKRLYFGGKSIKGYRILTWEKSRSGLKDVKYVLRQNPKDYTNDHLGLLENIVEGEQGMQSQTELMAEQLKHITIAHNYSAKEAAAQFGLSYDDAQMYLEMLRRSGVLASTWVVPESGNYRWRIYHSVNSQKAPPDDDYIDVESNVVPFPIGAISAAKSQGEVIEFEYTVTDDDDF
jgi:archaellum biogenesis ATPase FlaH